MTTRLDRATVIETALRLLNEVGIDNLTTRKLAEKLGVQQPALYWHFRNKSALLDALSEAIFLKKHKRSRPKKGEDWRVFLTENARSFRKALLSYRDGARVHVGATPVPDEDTAEIQIRFLCDAGFRPREAMWALIAIGHYVVGAVLEQQAPRSHSFESRSQFLKTLFSEYRLNGEDAAFEYGLESLIMGLDKTKSSM